MLHGGSSDVKNIGNVSKHCGLSCFSGDQSLSATETYALIANQQFKANLLASKDNPMTNTPSELPSDISSAPPTFTSSEPRTDIRSAPPTFTSSEPPTDTPSAPPTFTLSEPSTNAPSGLLTFTPSEMPTDNPSSSSVIDSEVPTPFLVAPQVENSVAPSIIYGVQSGGLIIALLAIIHLWRKQKNNYNSVLAQVSKIVRASPLHAYFLRLIPIRLDPTTHCYPKGIPQLCIALQLQL